MGFLGAVCREGRLSQVQVGLRDLGTGSRECGGKRRSPAALKDPLFLKEQLDRKEPTLLGLRIMMFL